MHDEPPRSRVFIAVLLLATLTILTLDAKRSDGHSPVDPMRTLVATMLGPTEDATAALLRPITDLPAHFRRVDDLRNENDQLSRQNAGLRTELRTAAANQNRTAELHRIGAFGDAKDFTIVPAQVIGLGPAQSFTRTVTIDAGADDGVKPDQTVLNGEGLVGRVISTSATTATVLLIVDGDSTVGGRLGPSMELGFVRGDGSVSGDTRLTFSLVDDTAGMRRGDTIVTWGSQNGAPYLPGIPIGQVTTVRAAQANLGEIGSVAPFVDFSSLDVVGIVTRADAATSAHATTQAGAR